VLVFHFGYDDAMDDLGSTSVSRRGALALLGAAGATGLLACVASPGIEEGPFFVDERLNRSDLTAGAKNPGVTRGVPLRLAFRVSTERNGACVPLAGAQVDLWHADATGLYSDEAVLHTSGQRFLRGYQITDRDGVVAFRTVYPGWYPGRTPHVHLKVRTFSASGQVARSFTSQLYFDESVNDTVLASGPYAARGRRDTTNARDDLFDRRMQVTPSRNALGYFAPFEIVLRSA
jgi:protocatechuate 3,4-dioxygenase beta subunit